MLRRNAWNFKLSNVAKLNFPFYSNVYKQLPKQKPWCKKKSRHALLLCKLSQKFPLEGKHRKRVFVDEENLQSFSLKNVAFVVGWASKSSWRILFGVKLTDFWAKGEKKENIKLCSLKRILYRWQFWCKHQDMFIYSSTKKLSTIWLSQSFKGSSHKKFVNLSRTGFCLSNENIEIEFKAFQIGESKRIEISYERNYSLPSKRRAMGY